MARRNHAEKEKKGNPCVGREDMELNLNLEGLFLVVQSLLSQSREY